MSYHQGDADPQPMTERKRIPERNDVRPSKTDAPKRRPQAERAETDAEQNDQSIVEHIQHELAAINEPKDNDLATVDRRIAVYQQRHLPDYLQNKKAAPPPLSLAFRGLLWLKETFGKTTVSGREHIPERGPFLIVANHSGGESAALYGIFHQFPLRLAAGEELNWKRSSFRAWLLRKFGMLTVRESLAHLSTADAEALMRRVPGQARQAAYRAILARDQNKTTALADAKQRLRFVQAAVAALTRGDVVGVFPEGPFLYDHHRQLRQAYGGIELIINAYEKLTGLTLPCLPVAIQTHAIAIGEPCFLEDDKQSDERPVDRMMKKIAELLPAELRGFYRDKMLS